MKNKKEKWYIEVCDDDCHYYVIPEEKKEDWYQWLEEDPDYAYLPEYAEQVEHFRFQKWEKL